MSELMRFRLARAPQKYAVEPDKIIPLYHRSADNPEAGNDLERFEALLNDLLNDPSRFVVGFQSDGITVLDKPATLVTPIDQLEKWLTSRENRPCVEDFSVKLNELTQTFYEVGDNEIPARKDLGANARIFIEMATENWWLDRTNIGFSMIVAMLRDLEPSRAVYLNRLMLVIGLVELAAENPGRLRTADDVYWALRWRLVILPKSLVNFLRSLRPHSLMARRPGFADLYVVRDEWARYEPGEIAHVENVMVSETRERSHTRTTETEEIVTIEEERSKLDERDTQSTDRSDLQSETSRDSSLNIGIEGSVDASGQYGAAKVSTHLGGNLDYSLNESQSQATTTAHETVARAVVRVEEKVRQVRTTRSLSRIEEVNKHSFKNDGPDSKHITGVYRWIDKIKRVQVFRYPNRFLIEFQVPEPGAWLRWLLNNKKAPTISEKPKPLEVETTGADGNKNTVELTPTRIGADNYLEIAARYKTLGLNPPPEDKVIATVVSRPSPEDPSSDKEPIRFQTGQLTVPDGYKAITWNATVQSWHNTRIINNAKLSLRVALGSGPQKGAVAAVKGGTIETQFLNGQIGEVSEGTIPISVMADTAYGWNVNVTVTCKPLPRTIQAWQIDTYSKIAQAYYAMKRQYDEEIAAQSVRGGVQIEGLSPAQNAEMVRVELKKSVIEMLIAKDFEGRDAYQLDANNKRLSPPEVNLQKAVQTAPEIQFIEQAFEWENLSYVLYPYFWTGKDQWEQLADLSGADPDFAKFLRAGSARVVVPARPGFELQALLYTYLGILWGGGPTPAPDDEDYFSIAEEIRAQEKPPRDGIPGESWPVRLPTTLVWLDSVNSSLPVENPNKKLDEPPGKVLP